MIGLEVFEFSTNSPGMSHDKPSVLLTDNIVGNRKEPVCYFSCSHPERKGIVYWWIDYN
jgi:hypothetical protein